MLSPGIRNDAMTAKRTLIQWAALALLTATSASGQLTWSLASGNESWPADKRAAIVAAMTAAVNLYNANGYFPKTLWANYNASVPTAQASYSGWIDFGGSISTRVALHEISHTLGVGTVSAWSSRQSGGRWTGSFALNRVRLFDGPSATIGCDTQHFWPYGLNYDSEDGTTNRVRHIKMVSAFRRDMGIVLDSDGDGIPDDWEMFYFGNLAQTATGDADGDGINNLAEYNADTHPAAATTTWLGTTNSDYTTSSNWSPNPGPSNGTFFTRINVNNGINNPLIYDATRGSTILRPADRGIVIGSGSSGSGSMVITGGSLSTVGATSPDVVGNGVGNSGSLTLEAGSFSSDELQLGINGQGTGTLTLNGGTANIGTLGFRFASGGNGILNLNAATLTTASINRSGSGSSTINVQGGTIRASTSSATFLENHTNTFIRSSGLTIDSSTFTITIAQPLRNDPSSPNGGVTKSGSGILSLSAANTYLGPTSVSAGILIPESIGALSASASVSSDATLALTGGQTYQKTSSLSLSGTGQRTATTQTPAVQRGALQSISGTNTWNGDIIIASSNTRIGVQDGASLIINGTIAEALPATSVIFRSGLNPGDHITLNTPGTWTGDSIAYSSSSTGGALRLGASNVLPASSTLLLAGNSVAGRVDLNGFNQTLAGLSNASGGSSPVGAGIIINDGNSPSTLTLTLNSTRTFIGTIRDGNQIIHLIKSGPSTQIFTAAQSYSGNTSVSAGTLRIDQPYLDDSSNVTIATGARLHLNFNAADTVGSLTLGNAPAPPGTYNSTTHPSFIFGTGSLIVPATFSNWLNIAPSLSTNERSPTADPDADGLANLVEYALGTLPHVSQQNPLSFTSSRLNTSITFDRLPTRTDLTLTVEASQNLATWSPVARSIAGGPFVPLLSGVQCSETSVAPDRQRVSVTRENSTEPASFLRLNATR